MMLASFFRTSMAAPGRQLAFRRATVFHLLFLTSLFAALELSPTSTTVVVIGQVLLVAGIVEGAVLIGWRLTQLPKSQALEVLFTSPVQPKAIYFAEALVGIARLALVTLSGLPILLLMLFVGRIEPFDLVPMLIMPFTWGAIAGIGLTVWAYENLRVRKIGESIALLGVLLYLIVGVLAGENLRRWLQLLPPTLGESLFQSIHGMHSFNPFGVMQYWMDAHRIPVVAWERMLVVQAIATTLLILLFTRAMCRLKGHFHDRHYRPIDSRRMEQTEQIGQRPLSWWAVRRVMEYSGRVNIWLAGGFGLLYAAYLVAGDAWPPWMGRLVFEIFERMGGAPALVTGLVVLAAVPAAFQYRLWDSSTPDRCRRLELLLLTDLDAFDYWHASLSAAWRRGRGYFAVALVMWIALGISGRASVSGIIGSISAAVILWGFSFVMGFLAFSGGRQANGLGTFLTLGLPALVFGLMKMGQPMLASFLPPGAVYVALTHPADWHWLPGPFVVALMTLGLAKRALSRCESGLRAWYNRNQGVKVAE